MNKNALLELYCGEKGENLNKIEKQKALIYELISAKEYRPMKTKEIAALLQLPKSRRVELQQILDELSNEGKIGLNKKGQYKKKKFRMQPRNFHKTGTFIGHPKGYGFVEIEGEEEDLYIPEDEVHGALHLDKVQVQLLPKKQGKRQEASVTKILDHGITELVGTYEKMGKNRYGFVIADNPKFVKDVFVPIEHELKANTGDKVVVTLTSYGGVRQNPQGRIKEVLGAVGAPGTDVLSIAKEKGLPMEFPSKVLKQADRIPDELNEGDFWGRKDLRDWTIVTIDGEDAKDLDDGVSLTREGDLYRLGVHIADVTNYVQDHSALDREALKRGTSVYLVDRVIPMLPKRLSNGICSLNAGEDRLTLSCIMDFDQNGNVVHHEIAETVINVSRRMSYTNVKKILVDEDADLIEEYKDLVPMFRDMEKLSALIRKKREERGAIDFDFPESKVKLDENGHPTEIYVYEQNVATRMIEDFMLSANETVAKEFCLAKIPFVYRVHENPDPDKIEQVLALIHSQGYHTKKSGQEIKPKEVQAALAEIEGSPKEPLFSRLFLRSMKQARYETKCVGHFGLAAEYYCHFTSPIRRYPDLQIHRIIKDTLRNRMNESKKAYYEEILDAVAEQSSQMERRAEETERETIKLKKAEYMADHIGEIYEGTISGVTSWGIYVELSNSIEGMIHLSSLSDDYYVFDEEKYQVVGESKGKTYGLGDPMTIRVADVDVEMRTIDFRLVTRRK